MENNSNLYTQSKSEINGRGVWHYLVTTPIGQFNIIEWEEPSKEVKRIVYDERYEDAVKKYESICKKIVSGKM